METLSLLITQGGGVISATYTIIEFMKGLIPDKYKQWIPLLSCLISGLLNIVVTNQDPLTDFIQGVLLGFSTSKLYDLKKSQTQSTIATTEDDKSLVGTTDGTGEVNTELEFLASKYNADDTSTQ